MATQGRADAAATQRRRKINDADGVITVLIGFLNLNLSSRAETKQSSR